MNNLLDELIPIPAFIVARAEANLILDQSKTNGATAEQMGEWAEGVLEMGRALPDMTAVQAVFARYARNPRFAILRGIPSDGGTGAGQASNPDSNGEEVASNAERMIEQIKAIASKKRTGAATKKARQKQQELQGWANDSASLVARLKRPDQGTVKQALIDAGVPKDWASAWVGDLRQTAKAEAQVARTNAQAAKKAEAAAEKEAARQGEIDRLLAVGLPIIQVNDKQLTEIRTNALAALAALNNKGGSPSIFVRNGSLIRVVRTEEDTCRVQPLDAKVLRSLLADAASWVTVYKEGKVVNSVCAPLVAAEDILALGDWPQFPPLREIVNGPTYAAGWVLHDKFGYDPTTRLYNAQALDIGDTNTYPENIAKAKRLILEELLGDFEFADQASRAHAVAFLLLHFVRHAIRGATPLHVVDSPTPGSGKGLLVDACAIPGTGRELSTTPAPDNDEEWRKKITTAIKGGASHVALDNISQNGTLESASLATGLTQPFWNDRLLGANQDIDWPIRLIWSATGNNIVMTQELARRSILIRIDTNLERPDKRRNFKHGELREWTKENRGALATAALTLIRSWLEADKKADPSAQKGSFEDWCRVMGGILTNAGIQGFLSNDERLWEVATNDAEIWREFIEAWWRLHKEEKREAPVLFNIASRPDDSLFYRPSEHLDILAPLLGAGNQRSRATRFGNMLKQKMDMVFTIIPGTRNADGAIDKNGAETFSVKLLRDGRDSGAKTWRLQKINTDSNAKTSGVKIGDLTTRQSDEKPSSNFAKASQNLVSEQNARVNPDQGSPSLQADLPEVASEASEARVNLSEPFPLPRDARKNSLRETRDAKKIRDEFREVGIEPEGSPRFTPSTANTAFASGGEEKERVNPDQGSPRGVHLSFAKDPDALLASLRQSISSDDDEIGDAATVLRMYFEDRSNDHNAAYQAAFRLGIVRQFGIDWGKLYSVDVAAGYEPTGEEIPF